MTTTKLANSLDYRCPNLQIVWIIIAQSLDYRCPAEKRPRRKCCGISSLQAAKIVLQVL